MSRATASGMLGTTPNQPGGRVIRTHDRARQRFQVEANPERKLRIGHVDAAAPADRALRRANRGGRQQFEIGAGVDQDRQRFASARRRADRRAVGVPDGRALRVCGRLTGFLGKLRRQREDFRRDGRWEAAGGSVGKACSGVRGRR